MSTLGSHARTRDDVTCIHGLPVPFNCMIAAVATAGNVKTVEANSNEDRHRVFVIFS